MTVARWLRAVWNKALALHGLRPTGEDPCPYAEACPCAGPHVLITLMQPTYWGVVAMPYQFACQRHADMFRRNSAW